LNVEKLKEAVTKVLPSVDVVIGYRAGFDPLHGEPYFMEKVDYVADL
jgi:hypothetical protein